MKTNRWLIVMPSGFILTSELVLEFLFHCSLINEMSRPGSCSGSDILAD